MTGCPLNETSKLSWPASPDVHFGLLCLKEARDGESKCQISQSFEFHDIYIGLMSYSITYQVYPLAGIFTVRFTV